MHAAVRLLIPELRRNRVAGRRQNNKFGSSSVAKNHADNLPLASLPFSFPREVLKNEKRNQDEGALFPLGSSFSS